MLKPSTPFLIAFMMLCVLIACKKKDPNWPVPGNDKCIAEKAESAYDTLKPGWQPLYDRGYRFKKTFNSDGSVRQLYISTPGPSFKELVNGLVVKTGNSLFLLDSLTKDTAFRATLDANGRVLSSHLSRPYANQDRAPYRYEYNDKGQLALIFYYGDTSIKLYYDNSGDIITTSRLAPDGWEDVFYNISYDYTAPLKGSAYELEIFSLEQQILEMLGYFDLSPRFKVTSVQSADMPTISTKYFFDQQVNAAGYLTDYKSSIHWNYDYEEDTVSTHIIWRCPKP